MNALESCSGSGDENDKSYEVEQELNKYNSFKSYLVYFMDGRICSAQLYFEVETDVKILAVKNYLIYHGNSQWPSETS